MPRKPRVSIADSQSFWGPERKPPRTKPEHKLWQEICAKDPSFRDVRSGIGPGIETRLKLRETGLRISGSNPQRMFNREIMSDRDRKIMRMYHKPLDPKRAEARLLKALEELE